MSDPVQTLPTSADQAAAAAESPALTLLEARTRFFVQNGFAADGGYGDRWIELAVGPLKVALPNTPARVRAVRYHDLHHVVTGYRTDLRGEAEISAWELGAGCKDMVAAWFLNLGAFGLGTALAPRRLFRAFARGRRSETLYGRPFEPLLTATIGEVRRDAGLEAADAAPRPLGVGGVALFGGTAVVGVAVAILTAVISVVVLPFGLAGIAARKRAAALPTG